MWNHADIERPARPFIGFSEGHGSAGEERSLSSNMGINVQVPAVLIANPILPFSPKKRHRTEHPS